MPYELRWYDATHSIMLIDAYDEVSWQDYRAIHEKICKELEQSPHRVDIIYNDRKVGFPGGYSMTRLDYILGRLRAYPVLGKIYFILFHNQPFIKAVVEMAAKAYRVEYSQYGSFVSSLKEALTLIKQDRSGIDIDMDDTEPNPPFSMPS